jgi:ribosomal subunit interface protein
MVNNRDRDVSIEVVSRHRHVSDKTRDFATERVGKLTRFHSRVSHIQVLLDERHDEFITEVIVHVDSGVTVVAKETASGYRASITSAVEKLERQIKKDKEKRQNHKHDPLGVQDDGSPELDAEETYEEVVKNDLSR